MQRLETSNILDESRIRTPTLLTQYSTTAKPPLGNLVFTLKITFINDLCIEKKKEEIKQEVHQNFQSFGNEGKVNMGFQNQVQP